MNDTKHNEPITFDRATELIDEIANAKQTDELIDIIDREGLGVDFEREAIFKPMIWQAEKIGFLRAQAVTQRYFSEKTKDTAKPGVKKRKR